MTPKAARSYLLYQLQSQLYREFYICGGCPDVADWSRECDDRDKTTFIQNLSKTNAGTGCWESGWQVIPSYSGETLVQKGGLKLLVPSGAYTVPDGAPHQACTPISIRLPKELLNISPGYYMALSNCGNTSTEAVPLVRLYWNFKMEGAFEFVHQCTYLLNDAHLFFRLKVLNDPAAYTRCDAGVLYFQKADYPTISEILRSIYPLLEGYLKPSVPMFTKFIAKGIGLAEDPGNHESFGQHRCRILAEGMICAYEQRAKSLSERLRIVKEYFVSTQIRLNEPYLNPDSVDNYDPQKCGLL